MTVNNVNVYALTYLEESTFGVEASGTYKRLKVVDRPEIRIEREMLAAAVRDFKLSHAPRVRGAASGTFSFTCLLRGSGTAAGDNVNTAAAELGPLFELCGLNSLMSYPKQGTAITSYLSPSCNVTAGEGSANFAVGSGAYSQSDEINFVSAALANQVTFVRGFATDPTSGATDELYNMQTYTPARDPADLVVLPSATLKFYTADYTLKLLGCAFDFKLRGNARGLVEVEFSGPFDAFEIAASGTPEDFGSWPAAGLKALGSPLYYDHVALPCAAFGFELGNNIQPKPDTGTASGRAGFFVADRDRMKLTATLYYNTTRFEDAASATSHAVTLALQGAAGNHVGIHVPAADVNFARGETNGLEAMTLEAIPVDPAQDWPGDVMIAVA